MKTFAAGLLVATALAGTASAGCYYQGYEYPVGSTVCSAGGWLEECTVADYWKAIGYCRAQDASKPTAFSKAENPLPGFETEPDLNKTAKEE